MQNTLTAALADRYEIEREVGRGGMATVYLARDLRHSRPVALKVLDPELGAVLGAERFLSEIRVTANLQHPNLLPLFDSGSAGGLLYYVMPFVDGETLRVRLERERQLPVDEAIRIATAIAAALDYAHRHGVIHRDLKPENILLHDGQPVVADFGIALALSNAGGQRLTQTGLSLGTPQYMSPEQATGDRTIDGRTDIYSLGAMTYEMLAGEPPHSGTTAQAIIAKLMTEEPRSLTVLRRSVPPQVDAAVGKALEKLPADRFASASEFADALNGRVLLPHRAGVSTRAGTPRARLWRVAPWAVATVALIVMTVALLAPRSTTWPREPVVVPFDFSDSVTVLRPMQGALAFSRDGSTLVYSGARDNGARPVGLFVRRLGDRAARLLPGTAEARWPSFSVDGRELFFVRAGKLFRVSVDAGGPPTVEWDSAAYVSVGDNGSKLIEIAGKVVRIPAGRRNAIAMPIADSIGGMLNAARFAEFLPGERHVLLTTRRSVRGPREIALMEIATGELTPLGLEGSHARYSATGHIVFMHANGSLMAVPFSIKSRRTTGAVQRLAEGVVLGVNGTGGYAISGNGSLVALQGVNSDLRHLEIVDNGGKAQRVSREPRSFGWTTLSPDGRRLAVEVAETPLGPWDVWVFDIESQSLSRVTSGGRGLRPGGWTASGREVVYLRGSVGDVLAAFALPWDGSGTPRLVMQYDGPIQSVTVAASWAAAAVGRLGATDIVIAPLDSPRATRPLATGPANENNPRLSPDGTMLAYTSDESGRSEVYLRPLPGPGTRIQVSIDGATEPVWDRRSPALYYRDSRTTIRATLALNPELRVVSRDSLFSNAPFMGGSGNPFYDAFPDGRFLMITESTRHPTPVLYLNWPSMLQRAAKPD
ncbi:MAG: protein kinase [Gemmatimonas sp.]